MQQNEFSNPEENSASLIKRLFIYQKERFPVLGHSLLVGSFCFSAIAYSRICRGAKGFIDPKIFAAGIFITITLFMLVRIFDEFKDAEDDAKYRKHLPIPRGLIKHRELLIIGSVIVCLQIIVNLCMFPKMLIIYFLIISYLCLMGKEFFVAEWLKKHQLWYVTSHMFIIPFIDLYASGLDWLQNGVSIPKGMIFFFAISYMNGIVLEIGRKIRTPENEADGVLTYTSMLGKNKAIVIWLSVLLVTCCLSIAAAEYAGYGIKTFTFLSFVFIICAIPAWFFLKYQTKKSYKAIELSSALWTITMYLTLGGVPMIHTLFI